MFQLCLFDLKRRCDIGIFFVLFLALVKNACQFNLVKFLGTAYKNVWMNVQVISSRDKKIKKTLGSSELVSI